jgi:hypothetical protein
MRCDSAPGYVPGNQHSVYQNRVITIGGYTPSIYSFYTIDGNTWIAGGTPTTLPTKIISFDGYGWLVAMNASVTNITKDGGVTWVAGGNRTASGTWVGCYDPIHNRIIAAEASSTTSNYTINGGTTWIAGGALSSATPVWSSMAYDPISQRVILISSNGFSVTNYSTDGGITWSVGGALSYGTFGILVYNPNNQTMVAIISVGGASALMAEYSSDGGTTWNTCGYFNSGLTTPAACCYDPLHNRLVLIDSSTSRKVLYSATGQGSWSAGGTLPNPDNNRWYNIVFQPTTGILIVTGSSTNDSYSTYSLDGGASWSTASEVETIHRSIGPLPTCTMMP